MLFELSSLDKKVHLMDVTKERADKLHEKHYIVFANQFYEVEKQDLEEFNSATMKGDRDKLEKWKVERF